MVVLRTVRADGSTNSNIQASLDAVSLRTSRSDGTISSTIQASPASAFLRNRRTDGTVSSQLRAGGEDSEVGMFKPNGSSYASLLRASSDEAYMFTSAGGATRYLSVDANGIWVKTNAGGGGWREYNLEETARDSGWIALPYPSGYEQSNGAPYSYRQVGNLIHLRGRIKPSTGTFSLSTEYAMGTIPSNFRPPNTFRSIISSGNSTGWGRVEVSASGSVTIAIMSGASSGANWIDLTGTYWTAD